MKKKYPTNFFKIEKINKNYKDELLNFDPQRKRMENKTNNNFLNHGFPFTNEEFELINEFKNEGIEYLEEYFQRTRKSIFKILKGQYSIFQDYNLKKKYSLKKKTNQQVKMNTKEIREFVINFLVKNKFVKNSHKKFKFFETILKKKKEKLILNFFSNSPLNEDNGEYLYVILLEKNKIYVGYSLSIKSRISMYVFKKESYYPSWVKKFKPIEIILISEVENKGVESFLTKCLMIRYGVNNVRGGPYTLNSEYEDELTREKNLIIELETKQLKHFLI